MINVVKILKLSACTVDTDLCWKKRTFLDSGNKNLRYFIIVWDTKRSQLYYNSWIINDIDHIITKAQFIVAVSKIYQFFKTMSLRSVAMIDDATVRLIVNVRYVPYVMRTLSNWNVLSLVLLNFGLFYKKPPLCFLLY